MNGYNIGLSRDLVGTMSKYTDFLRRYTHTQARTKYSKLLVEETSVVDALPTKAPSPYTDTGIRLPG